jgi:hypothetical protein
MTRTEFLGAMAPLSVNFRQQLTKPLLTLWWGQFQHCTPDEFREAVVQVCQRETFFPTIATMRDALGLNGNGLTLANQVFTELTSLPGPRYDPKRGDYWSLQDVQERFGTHALAAFLAGGGTAMFRDRTDRNLDFIRRDFLAGWAEFAKHPQDERVLLDKPRRPEGLAPIQEVLTRLLPGAPEEPT